MSFLKIFWKICFRLSLGAGFAACTIDEPIFSGGLQQASIQEQVTTKSNDPKLKPSNPDQAVIRRTTSRLPYKIDFDTAAFMNCPGDASPNDPIFFFLKFGAYGSGVQLNADVKQALAEISSLEKKQAALESLPLIRARAQLSLSSTGYPARIAAIGSGAIVNILTLHHLQVTKKLAQHGVSYKLADDRLAEMELPFAGQQFSSFKAHLQDYSVYLTYNKGSDARPVSPGKGLYHGRLFKPSFSDNFMTALQEKDLRSDKRAGKWTCPEKFRFAVHREPKFTRNHYLKNYKWFDSKELTPEMECKESAAGFDKFEQQLMKLVINQDVFFYGRTLKFSKGSDGQSQAKLLNSRCIAPKNFRHSCYNQVHRVEFDKSKCIDGDPVKACPAYLSICIKKSAFS